MATPPNVPQPLSYEQILSNELSAYATKQGLNDAQIGSLNTSLFEVMALVVARASGDIFSILSAFSIDRATGDTLKRIALENNVTPITANVSSGVVTVVDSTFQKISTKIYAGAVSPNIGSTTILVSDASLFPSNGKLYLGRGTSNIEGPISYTNPVAVGGHWSITLSSPTTKFHNVGESVILAQGGVRNIGVNNVVYSPAAGALPEIDFSVTTAAIILDGETTVTGVNVTAKLPGISGNVPAGGIKLFSNPPFAGATVFNPLPFVNGTASDTDIQLRIRIKRAKASTGLATASVVEGAVIGAVASDGTESGSIVSSNIINSADFATLFIDDGTGYEEKTLGVGIESIVDSALGGEQFFQLATGGVQTQVAKAFLISSLSSPFDVVGGDTLSVTVGEVTYSHNFANSDFVSPGGATAYELATSINADTSLGFQATTSGGGTFLVISAIAEANDSVTAITPTTSGRNVATQLGLTVSTIETLRLYKNNIPLSKDGNAALVFTQNQTDWSSSIANGETLIIAVDNTAPITFTITNADFVETGLYTSVSPANSLESWVEVFNNILTGLTAELVGTQIQLESNLGNNNRASIVIDLSSTLVTKGMFSSTLGLTSTGAASDYEFFRGTAQFELVVPLVAGDSLSAGTSQTEAIVKSGEISAGGLTLLSDAHVWILVDQPGSVVPIGLSQNSSITITKPSTNIVRYTSNITSAFSNVEIVDYVIIWSLELPSTTRFEGRVNAFTGDSLDLEVTSSEWTAATPVVNAIYKQGFVVVRSDYIPQKFKIVAGTSSLDQIAAIINSQTNEFVVTVSLEEFLVITSNSKDTSGHLLIITSDTSGQDLLLADKLEDFSKTSLIAFYDSSTQEATFPLFVHSPITSEDVGNPIDSYITTFNSEISIADQDPDVLVRFLKPYGNDDDQAQNEYVQVQSIVGNTVNINNEANLRRLRIADRFFVASPLDFGADDTAVVIVDNNPSSEAFEIPFFRLATTNTTFANNSSSFNAYDTASGPSAQFLSAFGNFDFSNFKVTMQAKKVLKAQASQTAILYRSVQSGSSGELISIGYIYPSAPNLPISSTVVVNSDVSINIVLQSGTPVTSNINSTTEWNVSIVPNTPVAGVDQVTYTYSGTGTAPALTLVGGEYVNIGNQTELSSENTGIFRVSTQAGFTPSSTSFSVQRPTGIAVAEANKATLVNGQISFYNNSPTTAAQIVSYVNSNLSQYLIAALTNDGGLSGSGVIVYTTYEDTNFVNSSVTLEDGVNWIASSNLASSPQFTLKNPLSLSSDVGYAFNNGEPVILTPTTMDQVARLLNILAVTGFTTVGTVEVVDRGTRVELSTDVLGSLGAIQVVGGFANGYSAPILGSAERINNTECQASIGSVAGAGIQSDQWFMLTATNKQKKITGFSSNTSINVVGNAPALNESTVTLLNRSLTQRYFGLPRSFVRTDGATFKVEKQGSLVCLSWNGMGLSPNFEKATLNFNDSGGGTLNAQPVAGSSDIEFQILSGNANFSELSIGDLVTISAQSTPNNGTFLVTGISDDGTLLRVDNENGVSQLSSGTFTFSGNSTAGDTFGINGVSLVAGTNFPIGVTQADTIANFNAVAGTVPGVTSSFVGNVVTITATSLGANVPISYSGTGVVTVSGSSLIGQPFTAGNFTASSAVAEGDNLIINGSFNILNQGKFRVIRRFNNSIYFANPDVAEEEVTLPSNVISLGVDSTTSLKVNATDHDLNISWNGVGTEPQLGLAQVGDTLTLGTDFASGNQGRFMVSASGPKLQQITSFVMPAGSQFPLSGVSDYFLVKSAANVNQYYVLFNVNGGTTDPVPVGLTGVQVNILNGDNAVTVASKAATALTTQVGITATSSGINLIVTTVGFSSSTPASNVTMPPPFSITIIQGGQTTFLTAIDPSAVSQSAVFVTGGVFQLVRPQMQFYEYDATVVGDSFVVTGNTLGTLNNGNFSVIQVLDRNNAIVGQTLSSVNNVSLNGVEDSVYVLEERPYIGYKHTTLVAAQPGSTTTNLITFDTKAQYEKIDQSAAVELSTLNKMNWPTALKIGLDSYRFDTGLIAQANSILYGNPRDPLTFPGVAAAGAEIFIRGPLVKRISVGIVIRTLTGVPFGATAAQVKTVVSSLINGNDIGQPIAISAIISAVNSVKGVRAVSITSPQYDSTHDLIALAASEKALIIDPTTDISVSLTD